MHEYQLAFPLIASKLDQVLLVGILIRLRRIKIAINSGRITDNICLPRLPSEIPKGYFTGVKSVADGHFTGDN